MKQIAFFEAFAFDPRTCDYTRWMGTAPLATIRKYGLGADLSHPYYGDESLCGADGWACKAHA
jgi:hypothetical protein